jgi:hypothetical protein
MQLVGTWQYRNDEGDGRWGEIRVNADGTYIWNANDRSQDSGTWTSDGATISFKSNAPTNEVGIFRYEAGVLNREDSGRFGVWYRISR